MSRVNLEVYERIIELVREVVDKNLDPFQVNVVELFEKVKPYLKLLEKPEELALDGEAISELTRLILRQRDWIKHRASLLYIDPMITLLRIEELDLKSLADAFRRAWHPIIEREQLTCESFKEALEYWRNLPSLEERRHRFRGELIYPAEIGVDELGKMGFLSKEEFTNVLEELWRKALEMAGERGKIPYWEFIFSSSFEETVFKAYLTSFLATYGYVEILVDPITDEKYVSPLKERRKEERSRSIAIPISYERWLEEWRKRLKK